MKKTLLSLLALTPFFCNGVSAQISVTDADLTGAYQKKSYSRYTTHDPSIFVDVNSSATDPTYYIYGTHRGAGSTSASKSYQQWSAVSYTNNYSTNATKTVKNCNGQTVTFGNFNANSWQNKGYVINGNEWAPDVIYNKTMKKWCLYMSVNGDHWCSSIVLLTSSSPKGPWTYQGPVVFSGFQGTYEHNGFAAVNDYKHTDLEIALGTLSSLPARYRQGGSWGQYWPNCIDPCVFYDEQGKLWMSYGSWSGGIFMFELDETNGLRDYTVKYTTKFSSGSDYRNCIEDPYYGKKIAGGWYASGEGSYIQYVNGYYYLFITNGGLEAAGGYQMRIYRSQNPDGPYVDPNGLSAVLDKYILNFGKDSGRDYGVKPFGNYKWDLMPDAEVAQGHNSATVDHNGHVLLVNHTRFANGGEGHQVRVHEMFQTEDGWLVASPYEYKSGNTPVSNKTYTTAEVAGDYQLMIHAYRQNTAAKQYATPVNITLNSDGTVSGEHTGSWNVNGKYINITLNKVLGNPKASVFHGVICEQVIDYSNIPALCFTACGTKKSDGNVVGNAGTSYTSLGLCIWGSKAEAKAAIKYTLENISVPISNGATIRTKPTLPTTGRLGAKVTWKSSDETIMANDGTIKGKGKVVMTMSVEKDGYAYSKAYSLTIDAGATPTTPVYYPSCGPKAMNNGWWTEFSEYYTINKGESAQFKFINHNPGTGDNWYNWLIVTANNMRGTSNYKEYFVLRNDNYGWDPVGNTGQNNMSKPYTLSSNFNWDTFMADMNGASVDMTVSYTTAGHITMNAIIKSTSGKTFPYNFGYNAGSSDAAITVFFTTEKAYIEPAATAVRQITESVMDAEGEAVNLAGQKVGPAYKGIIIRNGKKFYRR